MTKQIFDLWNVSSVKSSKQKLLQTFRMNTNNSKINLTLFKMSKLKSSSNFEDFEDFEDYITS